MVHSPRILMCPDNRSILCHPQDQLRMVSPTCICTVTPRRNCTTSSEVHLSTVSFVPFFPLFRSTCIPRDSDSTYEYSLTVQPSLLGSSYFAFIPIGAAPSSAVPIDQMTSSYNNSQSQTTSGPTNASPTKQAQNISQSLFPSKSPVTPAPSPMPATSPQTVGVSSPPRRNNEVRVRHDPAHRHSARPET